MNVRFAYQPNCWGPLGGNEVGVTSIGQLTYVTFGDMSEAIADIGAARLAGVADAAAALSAEHLVVGGDDKHLTPFSGRGRPSAGFA